MEYKILLVEDDDNSALLISNFLEEFDFKVDIVNTVTDAISNINFNKYSIILLDINLPDFNGFEVLKFVNKNKKNIPILVLSAYSDKNTKLQAFKLGANDYMVKPIDPEELEARIWVQLKNSSNFISNTTKKSSFEINDNVISFNEEPLKLTKTEFEILSFLIKHKNQIVKREKLLDFLSSIIQSDRSLDYHIKNIRIKLADNASNPKYLLTEYGVGYKLVF
ncbi:response regulator transcription factor [Aliarcobacter butzleri]|uniref:response regulator transcription factor n=1 Tax=Aliarcobacter butzleri TaxID=28197 RepID=UPI00125FE7E7|nr:response regulator transcription factor [Aliarcobacter butzleri]MCT7595584.1 response regulator transcription factor [Aliarcobacter butzleri]MCT7600309.1 response regulator transcription factor [Aliarcobacter butzleri]MCT7652837.1 response regulator transcription factor [Aliarcobacter butzleri]